MSYWNYLKSISRIIIQSFRDFFSDDVLKYSASLSYYTVFSITPMLVIIIGLAAIFFEEKVVSGEVSYQLSALMGTNAAELVQQSIQNIKLKGQGELTTIISIGTLLIGATGVFSELQDTLNKIWSIKVTAKRGIVKYLLNRLLSFSMVITLGFLLIVSLLINTVISIISRSFFPFLTEWKLLSLVINNTVIFGIVTLLFGFIFKFLPDVKLKWKDVMSGAVFTTILFFIGKYLIGTYLANSNSSTVFGGAGALAIVLLWVYYSSAILFFGAEFTKNYILVFNKNREADDYATFVTVSEETSHANNNK